MMKKDSQKDQEIGKVSAPDEGGRKKQEKPVIHTKQQGRPHFPADDIRNELSRLEKKAREEWMERYGHLSKDNFQKIFSEKLREFSLPAHPPGREEATTKKEEKIHNTSLEIQPSPPYPGTSSSLVGWRSSSSDHSLELLGKLYISPRHTIDPPLLPGEFRVTEQKYIFLG